MRLIYDSGFRPELSFASTSTLPVYALLSMSSDDPSAARLSADYGASWETVFRKLVTLSLSNRMSVEAWDEKEVGADQLDGRSQPCRRSCEHSSGRHTP